MKVNLILILAVSAIILSCAPQQQAISMQSSSSQPFQFDVLHAVEYKDASGTAFLVGIYECMQSRNPTTEFSCWFVIRKKDSGSVKKEFIVSRFSATLADGLRIIPIEIYVPGENIISDAKVEVDIGSTRYSEKELYVRFKLPSSLIVKDFDFDVLSDSGARFRNINVPIQLR